MTVEEILSEGRRVNTALAKSLETHLPELSNSWWDECVVGPLLEGAQYSGNPTAVINHVRRLNSLGDLDLQQSVSVFHSNWNALSKQFRWQKAKGITLIRGMKEWRNWMYHDLNRAGVTDPDPQQVYIHFATVARFLRIVCPDDPQCGRMVGLRNQLFESGLGPLLADHDLIIRSAISEEYRGMVGEEFVFDDDASAELESRERGLLKDYGGWLEGVIYREIEPLSEDEVKISQAFSAMPSEMHERLRFLMTLNPGAFLNNPSVRQLVDVWRSYESWVLVDQSQALLGQIDVTEEEIEEPAEVVSHTSDQEEVSAEVVVDEISETSDADAEESHPEEDAAVEETEEPANTVTSLPDQEEMVSAEVAVDEIPETSDGDAEEGAAEEDAAVEEIEEPADTVISLPDQEISVEVAPDESFRGLESGILLWGAPGSGKSTYASSLVFHQERENESGEPDWYVMPKDLEAAQFVADVVKAYQEREAPPKTDLVRPLTFRITEMQRPKKYFGRLERSARPKRQGVFNFVDPRGETFTNDEIGGRQRQIILDLLEKADGLLLLIDPTDTQQDGYLEMFVRNLGWMFRHLRSLGGSAAQRVRDNRLGIPVAICLTKMDQFPPLEEKALHDLLVETVGEAGYNTLRAALSDSKIFGLSALGRVVDDGGVTRPSNGLAQPWEVLTPLKWLMDKK
jgi:GTPase SAR1 family protein